MSWFYAEGTTQRGPVNEDELQRLASSGGVGPETLVWREGMAAWIPAGRQAPHLFGAPGVTPVAAPAPVATARCVACGGTFPRKDMVAYAGSLVCASCRDPFFQKIREGVSTPALAALNYAGFWIRLGAYLIDYIVLMVVQMMVQFPVMAMFGFGVGMQFDPQSGGFPPGFFAMYGVILALQFIVVTGYKVFFLGRFGATPGKMALSLKVVRSDGGRITHSRALGRALAQIVSAAVLFIGYIIAGFDEEKRALHDRIADTRVVRT